MDAPRLILHLIVCGIVIAAYLILVPKFGEWINRKYHEQAKKADKDEAKKD